MSTHPYARRTGSRVTFVVRPPRRVGRISYYYSCVRRRAPGVPVIVCRRSSSSRAYTRTTQSVHGTNRSRTAHDVAAITVRGRTSLPFFNCSNSANAVVCRRRCRPKSRRSVLYRSVALRMLTLAASYYYCDPNCSNDCSRFSRFDASRDVRFYNFFPFFRSRRNIFNPTRTCPFFFIMHTNIIKYKLN